MTGIVALRQMKEKQKASMCQNYCTKSSGRVAHSEQIPLLHLLFHCRPELTRSSPLRVWTDGSALSVCG